METTRAVLAYLAFIAAGYLHFGVAIAARRRDRRRARWFTCSAVALALVGVGLLCSNFQW
ncbi:hypothetical protein [Micromonospora sp. NPDC001898]|uniref:hypothetical protein n=1 Tax=Micromonospora sp. NPDC001898 TaxID=3364221 RepID=UPI0036CCBE0E